MENMNEGKGRDDSWHGRAIFFLGGECHFILYQLSTLYLFIFKKSCVVDLEPRIRQQEK